MTAGGKDYVVQIASDDFQNDHFINPSYKTEIDGQLLNLRWKRASCYGFSSHLIMMILGAYLHN